MYKNGQGAPRDYVLAYMWANIAADNVPANELQQTSSNLDSIAENMTPQQIAEAKELARKCTANKLKGCKRE
jgi:TPR repeat protein